VVFAILSDIHSNLEALEAVLERVDELGAQTIWCLGDVVGYNADPRAVLDIVLSRSDQIVRGNHDKAAAGLADLAWFNDVAREAALWTRARLPPSSLDALSALPKGPRLVREGILICHGSPVDEDDYVFDRAAIRRAFEGVQREHPGTRFCFHGHTHRPLVAARSRADGAIRVLPDTGPVLLDPACAWLINPGSVGQPRDGNPAASFGILDTAKMTYCTHRAAYDVRAAQRKISEADLPRDLALRLAGGW
jgi:predicted phosphodiesterase